MRFSSPLVARKAMMTGCQTCGGVGNPPRALLARGATKDDENCAFAAALSRWAVDRPETSKACPTAEFRPRSAGVCGAVPQAARYPKSIIRLVPTSRPQRFLSEPAGTNPADTDPAGGGRACDLVQARISEPIGLDERPHRAFHSREGLARGEDHARVDRD